MDTPREQDYNQPTNEGDYDYSRFNDAVIDINQSLYNEWHSSKPVQHEEAYHNRQLQMQPSNERQDSDFGNDSDMNDFITKDIPMLDDYKGNADIDPYRDIGNRDIGNNLIDNMLQVEDIPEILAPKKLYLYNFAINFGMSFWMNSITFLCGIELAMDNESWIIRYIIDHIFHLIAISYVFYGVITPDTYKSINLSSDILPINWVLYNYPLRQAMSYLGIIFISNFLGAYVSIGLYYTSIKESNKTILVKTILASDMRHSIRIESFILNICVHLFLVSGSTIIMGQINSINSRDVVFYTILFIFITTMIFEPLMGSIIFVFNKLWLYLACYSIFHIDMESEETTMFFISAISLVMKLFIYPIVAYYTKYVWSKYIRSYIEYSS